MSELGVFAVDRGVFDHPILSEPNRAYSRREAWLWLLAEAAWKPRKVGRIGATIELERGQAIGAANSRSPTCAVRVDRLLGDWVVAQPKRK